MELRQVHEILALRIGTEIVNSFRILRQHEWLSK
jgi:hypothetical protein